MMSVLCRTTVQKTIETRRLTQPVLTMEQLGIEDIPLPFWFVPRYFAIEEAGGMHGCHFVFNTLPFFKDGGWRSHGARYEIGFDDTCYRTNTPDMVRCLSPSKTLVQIARQGQKDHDNWVPSLDCLMATMDGSADSLFRRLRGYRETWPAYQEFTSEACFWAEPSEWEDAFNWTLVTTGRASYALMVTPQGHRLTEDDFLTWLKG